MRSTIPSRFGKGGKDGDYDPLQCDTPLLELPPANIQDDAFKVTTSPSPYVANTFGVFVFENITAVFCHQYLRAR